MQNIIEDLLTLSCLESTDDLQDISTSINMKKVINHVCQDLNQAVMVEINTDEVMDGVETEIISLCTNLIQNAIFYTPKGTAQSVCRYLTGLSTIKYSARVSSVVD
jgi:light-regulated signal transduction histidine kinase (bacteriophytochrome)